MGSEANSVGPDKQSAEDPALQRVSRLHNVEALGELITERGAGEYVRLFSDFPFPRNTDGGPADDFQMEALTRLRQDPTQPVYRFETRSRQRSPRGAWRRGGGKLCPPRLGT